MTTLTTTTKLPNEAALLETIRALDPHQPTAKASVQGGPQASLRGVAGLLAASFRLDGTPVL